MNRSIAAVTADNDTVQVVRNDITGNYGLWLERRNPDNTIEMSHVTWLSPEVIATLATTILKETA